jgi:hypothetical protein
VAELAPGVFVSELVPSGQAFVIDAAAFGLGEGRAVAVSEVDWRRIPAADRERFLDDVTRESAEAGVARLQAYLREVPA